MSLAFRDPPAEIGRELRIPPCPECGEPLGGRYGDERLCWPCWCKRYPEPPRPRQAPGCPEWQRFRRRIIGALDRVESERFVYIDEDRIVHVCPVCEAELPEYLVVRFHARAPRAEIRCSLGCPDGELARAFGIEVVT